MEKKIDIILLAGFLGAGKTTLMNELIQQFSCVKLGLLVNDFGDVPVDGSLLKSLNPELLEGGHKVYEIGNGSIFCSCLKAPFLYGLKYFQREKPNLLFIEASGLSDPSSMTKILKEHNLEGAFQVKKVLTLVDPLKYKKLSHVLEVIPRQVEAADALLINKSDLVSSEELDQLRGELALINPHAEIQRGSFGQFDFSLIRENSDGRKTGDRQSCNTPETRPASLFLEGRVSKEELLLFLDEIEGDIYRLKGFMEWEGEMNYISDTGRGFSMNAVEKKGIKPGITVLCPQKNGHEIAIRWKKILKLNESGTEK